MDPLISGLLGYLLGKTDKKPNRFFEKYKERLNHLKYFRAVKPEMYIREVNNGNAIYNEAVHAYLCGLPNSSIPMSLKCLELGLKHKYEKTEGKRPHDGLSELIDWGERYLGNKKDMAHGFRLLRNLIHESELINEKDALEAIVHITEVLNLIYPYDSIPKKTKCSCGTVLNLKVDGKENFLGNILKFRCPKCGRVFSKLVFLRKKI